MNAGGWGNSPGEKETNAGNVCGIGSTELSYSLGVGNRILICHPSILSSKWPQGKQKEASAKQD